MIELYSVTLKKGVKFLWNLGTQLASEALVSKSQMFPFSFTDLPIES